ncbi:MAG: hypothetical protein KDB80_03005, partial [Planctomycetes bacterium]|nr:hypothetical protein [Planctomycetota bacterium]
MRGLRPILIVLLLPGALAAQGADGDTDAVRAFQDHFVRARRLAHAREPDYDEARAELDAADGLVAALPTELQDVSRLGIEVSGAELLVFERRDGEATTKLVAARQRALDDDAWRGPYRELADVLLWNIAPAEFDAIWNDEKDFLREREAAHTKPEARDALEIVRLSRELDLRPGVDTRDAERELVELAERMSPGDWRDKAYGVLTWYFLLRRDLRRASAWADRLPADVGR